MGIYAKPVESHHNSSFTQDEIFNIKDFEKPKEVFLFFGLSYPNFF
jgi:hypothetical protein